MNRSIVTIITGDNPAQNVETALDTKAWTGRRQVNNESALVKVNLTGGSPQRPGETTTLEAADAVVHYLQSIGYKVTVCEGSSGIYSAPIHFERSGYKSHFEKIGIPCIDLSNVPSRMVYLSHADCYVPIPNLALDSDLIVQVPVPKRHFITVISCALKNIGIGMLARSSKMSYHGLLDRLIPDVNAILNRQMIVVDATWGLAKTGPFNGTPVKLDAVIAGDDPVAVDSICCRIMGLNPMNVAHIKNAHVYGVGQVDPEVQGCSIDIVKRAFRDA